MYNSLIYVNIIYIYHKYIYYINYIIIYCINTVNFVNFVLWEGGGRGQNTVLYSNGMLYFLFS